MITLDVIVVGAVVAVAFFFTFRKLYRDVRGKASCNCGCSGGCDNHRQASCPEGKGS
ncbi:MAG: FeoB-associated Cys-rich membrane protein [Pseudomonadota bacterium]